MWKDGCGGVGNWAAMEVDGGAAGARTTAIAGERERERGLAIGSHYGFAYERGFRAENYWELYSMGGGEPYKCRSMRETALGNPKGLVGN